MRVGCIIRGVRPGVVEHRRTLGLAHRRKPSVRRSQERDGEMTEPSITASRPSPQLFGLLPREQAARRLPCPSKYHEYDNPTLLEKYQREGKKAQLLC
jgi:hypothetical protein